MVMKEEAPKYMTRVEAADYVGVHPRTITRWITEGHLSKRPGRRGRKLVTLVRTDELDELMKPTPVSHDG